MKALERRSQVKVLIGGRRTGKTVLLKQLVRSSLDEGVPPTSILYLQIDHPQLVGTAILDHLREFRKLFLHPRDRRLHVFLDEVQDSTDWEIHLKAVHDMENVKLTVSGPTASLIAMQGGKLTGRQAVVTLYPLSFGEFLAFRNIVASPAEGYLMERAVDDYLQTGGYPEQVLLPSDDYLRSLLDDILARDIMRRQSLRKSFILADLARHLASGVGSRISFNRAGKVLGVDADTVKEYIGYLMTAYVIAPCERWTASATETIHSRKKYYFIDTGMKTHLTGKGDAGFKAENAVFMKFLRAGSPAAYFYEAMREIDFVTGRIEEPVAVEVKYAPGFEWREQERKWRPLEAFFEKFPGAREAVVVTKDVERELKSGHGTIRVVPLWKYLLEE